MDKIMAIVFLSSSFIAQLVACHLISIRWKQHETYITHYAELYRKKISPILLITVSFLTIPLFGIFDSALDKKIKDIVLSLPYLEKVPPMELHNAIYQAIKWVCPILAILVWIIFICLKLYLDLEHLKQKIGEIDNNNKKIN